MPFAQRPDARIWWDQDGTGDPILLIMGHAYGADMWHRTAPELAASYRVIRFDNRGAGRSSDPAGPYPVRLMAEDALAVLDLAGAGSGCFRAFPARLLRPGANRMQAPQPVHAGHGERDGTAYRPTAPAGSCCARGGA